MWNKHRKQVLGEQRQLKNNFQHLHQLCKTFLRRATFAQKVMSDREMLTSLREKETKARLSAVCRRHHWRQWKNNVSQE